jgi:hypothetical protein
MNIGNIVNVTLNQLYDFQMIENYQFYNNYVVKRNSL